MVDNSSFQRRLNFSAVPLRPLLNHAYPIRDVLTDLPFPVNDRALVLLMTEAKNSSCL